MQEEIQTAKLIKEREGPMVSKDLVLAIVVLTHGTKRYILD